jgi:uncharacterized alkaline shock family protein YloU
MDSQESTIETGDDQEGSLGQIKVNHTVVSTIVKMAAINVSGVLAIGGNFVENFIAQISSKESDKGVRVSEDEAGNYQIEIRVLMEYGVELAKTAETLQMIVAKQVTNMTGKPVANVDVIIEGVKMADDIGNEDPENPENPE